MSKAQQLAGKLADQILSKKDSLRESIIDGAKRVGRVLTEEEIRTHMKIAQELGWG